MRASAGLCPGRRRLHISSLNLKLPIWHLRRQRRSWNSINRPPRYAARHRAVMDSNRCSNRRPPVIPAHTLHTPEEALRVREKLAHQVLNPEAWAWYSILQVADTWNGRLPACGCVWMTCCLTV